MNQISSIHFEIVNVYHSQKKIFRKLKLKRKISRNSFINLKMTFHQFKNDEFSEFKTKFLHEVKSFKDNILNTTPKNTGN